MSAHGPFNGPEDRPSNWLVSLGDVTAEQVQAARRTIARQARDSDDERLLLATLGLDRQ